MKLEILQFSEVDNLTQFISFWSKLYFYNGENMYDELIEKEKLSEEDLLKLYIWKNGTNLSKLKNIAFETKILSKLVIINNMKLNDFSLEDFLIEFDDLSAVWKIFLLHVIKPNTYPIYDQHVHRTFHKINSLEWEGISNDNISNKNKEKFYFGLYLPFLKENNIKDFRKLDKAFFAYGQFLKTNLGKQNL